MITPHALLLASEIFFLLRFGLAYGQFPCLRYFKIPWRGNVTRRRESLPYLSVATTSLATAIVLRLIREYALTPESRKEFIRSLLRYQTFVPFLSSTCTCTHISRLSKYFACLGSHSIHSGGCVFWWCWRKIHRT